MGTAKQYDEEFKKQAVKPTKKIGNKAAVDELGSPKGTLGTWLKKGSERRDRYRLGNSFTGGFNESCSLTGDFK